MEMVCLLKIVQLEHVQVRVFEAELSRALVEQFWVGRVAEQADQGSRGYVESVHGEMVAVSFEELAVHNAPRGVPD